MNNFYQNIITQKSWQLLQLLKKQFKFVLIGGWAVYLYTKALKSKDIDIIVDYPSLNELKNQFDVYKNNRLKKYEIKQEGIDIDIYLPHYSVLGLPVEKLITNVMTKETFALLKPELLLLTKQKAYKERQISIKGQKDKIDIFSLIFLEEFDFNYYLSALHSYDRNFYKKELIDLIKETREIKELGLNEHQFAKRKQKLLKLL